MEDKIYKSDAKQIVDLCFNNKLFKEDVTRDDMNGFEELISFLLKSRFESYERSNEFLKSISKKTPAETGA